MMRELVDGPAKSVWVRLGLPLDDLENLWLTEMPDPSVNSSFKLGTAAQVCTTYSFRHAPHPSALLLLCKTVMKTLINFLAACLS